MANGEVLVDKRGNLDPLIASRPYLYPIAGHMIFAPSRKNIPYGAPFRGLLADFYLWNRSLTHDEMDAYTTDCTYLPSMEDVYLDWSKVPAPFIA